MVIAAGSPLTLDRHASGVWVRRFARTTPGLVVVIAVAVAALCIAAGVVCAAAVNGRIAEQKAVLEHSEPFAYAAQNLYAASSAADAAAATAFLSGGTQTPLMRARYQQALAAAASALADATAGAPDAETRKALAEVSAQLATYTGLVEAARANNVQGFPIGSAYLREASSSMQTKVLPGAEKVYAADLARVDQAQRRVGSLPMVGLALLAVALAAIGIGSAIMYKRTNRTFNLGLVAAAVVVVLVMVWIVGGRAPGGRRHRARPNRGHGAVRATRGGSHPRPAGPHRRNPATDHPRRHHRQREVVLRPHRRPASPGSAPPRRQRRRPCEKWVASHRMQVDAYRAGDYPAAVAQALGTDPGASGAQFAAVESSLRDAIEHARATMRGHVSDAGGYLVWLPTATLVLMALAAAAAVVGLWPRLKEFL